VVQQVLHRLSDLFKQRYQRPQLMGRLAEPFDLVQRLPDSEHYGRFGNQFRYRYLRLAKHRETCNWRDGRGRRASTTRRSRCCGRTRRDRTWRPGRRARRAQRNPASAPRRTTAERLVPSGRAHTRQCEPLPEHSINAATLNSRRNDTIRRRSLH
jgi:hypothetical protein